MADEQNPAAAPGEVQDLGGASRVTTSSGGEANPTLEEQAAEQAKAKEEADKKAGITPAAEEQETAEQKATREAAEAKAKEDADKAKPPAEALKGTIFDGLSPEMQTKIAPFAVAFNENGTLTDAEITEAAHATGMTEAVVKQFMAGADKEVGNLAADAAPVFEVFDGPDGYKEFQAWTNEAGNLTEPEKRSINKALGIGPDGKLIEGAKPDYETAAQLMQAPAARWKEAGGGPTPRDVTKGKAAGAAAGAEAGDSYANWAQVQADMSKKEYRTDAQFRKAVEQKIARSGALA